MGYRRWDKVLGGVKKVGKVVGGVQNAVQGSGWATEGGTS